jgi:hypothetical protein
MNDLNSIISILRLPSGIIGVLAFLIYVFKFNPVTFVTSSSIEKILLSKEKRVLIRIMTYLGHVLLSTGFITYIALIFYYSPASYSQLLTNVVIILLCPGFIFFLINNEREKHFEHVFEPASITTKYIVISLCLLYIVLIYLLTSYYLGSKMLTDVAYTDNLQIIAFTITSSLIFSFMIHVLVRAATKFLNVTKAPKIYIVDSNNKKWYIYHPIGKDKLLLGNSSTLNDSDEYIIRERNEIIKSFVLVKEMDS